MYINVHQYYPILRLWKLFWLFWFDEFKAMWPSFPAEAINHLGELRGKPMMDPSQMTTGRWRHTEFELLDTLW